MLVPLIQIRRDTADNWSNINPVLARGEFGLAYDTEVTKMGDGVKTWNQLEPVLGIHLNLQDIAISNVKISNAFGQTINPATKEGIDAMNVILGNLSNKDFAKEATLGYIKNVTDSIKDGVLERASEASLQAVLEKLSGVLPVSINNSIATRLAGNNAEISSTQHAELAGTVATYSLAEGASKMELYLESGYIRIRTDGQPATATTGEPLGEGFGASWAADSISVYFVEDSVLTVVVRP